MYSLCASRHQNTIQQTSRASIDTAVFLVGTASVSRVSACVCVCVDTSLNIISQTCQVAGVAAIQREEERLRFTSVRVCV